MLAARTVRAVALKQRSARITLKYTKFQFGETQHLSSNAISTHAARVLSSFGNGGAHHGALDASGSVGAVAVGAVVVGPDPDVDFPENVGG